MYWLIRYYIFPPAAICFFTAITQVLVSLGNTDRELTLDALLNPGTVFSWQVVLVFFLWTFLSLKLSSKEFLGPTSPVGYVPRYVANGTQYYIISILSYFTLIYFFPYLPIAIYIYFADIVSTLNIIALVLCVFLIVKGHLFPEVTEGATDKPFLYQLYAGLELHPRFLGVDIKQWTNCRIGMLGWALLVINFAVVAVQLHGFSLAYVVNAFLINIYLLKFFYWETGYFNTLDITLDRAGYYLCWGCICFVQAFYTFSGYYLVQHTSLVSGPEAFVILLFGLASVMLNYMSDYQKEKFKASGGQCYIWGRMAKFVEVEYKTNDGKKKRSKLLISGFWGISRHMNYVFELMLALSWSLPARHYGPVPFFYVIFLAILLIHRTFRDEEKCSAKYGKGWEKYCQMVPYRMIPYIF